MNYLEDINWTLFSAEEKETILSAISNGDWQSLCCLPEVPIDTEDKEKEIEKIVIDMRGITCDDESEVRKEMDDFWQKGGEMTPELEKEYQDKLNLEEAERDARLKGEVIEDEEPEDELESTPDEFVVEAVPEIETEEKTEATPPIAETTSEETPVEEITPIIPIKKALNNKKK
jgi:hypothetical protein